MQNSENFYYTPALKKRSIWQKVGAGSLSISLVIHLMLLAVGVVWVFQVIPSDKEKVVDFDPKGGGGQSASEVKVQKVAQAKLVSPNSSRIVAHGALSSISLPDFEQSQLASLSGSLASQSGEGPLGGGGNGGEGLRNGLGGGPGGLGRVPGGGGTASLFGMLNPNGNSLVGTFYDLKQTKNRQPTGVDDAKTQDILYQFVTSGWKERMLKDYFSPDVKLYQTKFFIPVIPASLAPAAFDCADEVEPKRIVILYRGTVTPPKSGKYRFVGCGDDVLAVRFNGKNVFDYGYTIAALGKRVNGAHLTEKTEDKVMAKRIRDAKIKLPYTRYQYDTTSTLNSQIGGLAAGQEFEAVAGKSYPIEILISEIPGGYFSTVLMIEEVGVEYQKTSNGMPIFPLFRLDSSEPEKPKPGTRGLPPYDRGGPVWKLVNQNGTPDF